jgi:putative oxidoreductase
MKSTMSLLAMKFDELGLGQLAARIAIAVVLWPHGAQLLLGMFGGDGFGNTMNYFTTQAGLPWIVGAFVIMIQFFGSLMVLAGFMTRFVALALAFVVVGMIFSGHVEHGFFMNWFGTQKGEGYEYHLLLLGLCVSLVFAGRSTFSIDRLLTKR